MRTGELLIAALLVQSGGAAPVVAATGTDAGFGTEYVPVYLAYGDQAKVQTQLYSPFNNRSLEVCYDLGSDEFWLFGPGAIINWGEIRLAWQGQCNATVPSYNDWPADPSATGRAELDTFIAYGGFTKLVEGNSSVNQSLVFTNTVGVPATLENTRSAIVDYIQWRKLDSTGKCENPPYDQGGIMGVGTYTRSPGYNTTGVGVRQDALERGVIGAATHCLWFDRVDSQADDYDYRQLRTGGGLWGGIDHSKFTGPLVQLAKLTDPAGSVSNQYFVSAPRVSSGGELMPVWTDWQTVAQDAFPACLLDSGGFQESLPVNSEDIPLLLNATGIHSDDGFRFYWPGPCSELPSDRTLDFEFPGLDPQESLKISIPLRNWVRYDGPDPAQCDLSISFFSRCLFAAPFFSYAFFAADDDRLEVAMAQGGMSERGSAPDYSQVQQRLS